MYVNVERWKTNLEDRLRHLHDPGFEGEDDVRVVRGQFDLHQAPDTYTDLNDCDFLFIVNLSPLVSFID